MTAFLIRYQEFVRATLPQRNATATQTHTFVRNEQADPDYQCDRFRTVPLDTSALRGTMQAPLPACSLLCKTKTITEVQREGADKDPGLSSLAFIPKKGGR
jgi:hypothetical protein